MLEDECKEMCKEVVKYACDSVYQWFIHGLSFIVFGGLGTHVVYTFLQEIFGYLPLSLPDPTTCYVWLHLARRISETC